MKRVRVAWLWLGAVGVWITLAPRSGMDLGSILLPPTGHWGFAVLGTDAFGRDLFRELGEAMGRSLSFALLATLGASVAGICGGGVLGLITGRLRFILERGLDFFLAFPPILLALALQAHVGTGWRSLFFSVTFGLFPGVVRFTVARAKALSVTEYLASARALGGSGPGIFWRHYRPDLFEHLRLKLPSLFAQALMLEATLSFLNLGVAPGEISWGALLGQAKDYLVEAPHIAAVVGPPLVLSLLVLQSGIDDATRTRQRRL